MLTTFVASAGGVGAVLLGAWAVSRARRSRAAAVGLVDVSLPEGDGRDPTPVVDIEVRNAGTRMAVFHRLIVRTVQAARLDGPGVLMPYRELRLGARTNITESCDLILPPLEKAGGAEVTMELAHTVAPGDAARFRVRLGLESRLDTVIYLLSVGLEADAANRTVRAPLLAIACPRRGSVRSVQDVRRDIELFVKAVGQVRAAIDAELATRGLPAPDWAGAPPRARAELPTGLVSLDGNGSTARSGSGGVYETNENFWDPRRAIEKHLDAVERSYQAIVDVVDPAPVRHRVLSSVLADAQEGLRQLPGLRARLRPAITAQ